MFYPSKKRSCMGLTHAALGTGAKFKSMLLSEQLTQINNYQTEGLLAHIYFLSGTCSVGQALQETQLLPQMWEDQLQFGLTSLLAARGGSEPGWAARASPHWPSPWIGLLRRRGRRHVPTCRLVGILCPGRSRELEGIRCWDAANSRVNFAVKGTI